MMPPAEAPQDIVVQPCVAGGDIESQQQQSQQQQPPQQKVVSQSVTEETKQDGSKTVTAVLVHADGSKTVKVTEYSVPPPKNE